MVCPTPHAYPAPHTLTPYVSSQHYNNPLTLYNTGTTISTYDVQDKKQVAEFDFQQWVGENIEEEEEDARPCPVCNTAEREDILLLCDSCDAAYHTHCLGLENIPEGDWYCLECRDLFQLPDEPEHLPSEGRISRPQRRPQPRVGRGDHVRTRARLRRARQQQRNFEWQGAWGQFTGRFYDLSDVDLDNADNEDEELEQFRRFQQLDRRELHRWQQRMNIANRLGARETFVHNIPPQISEHLQPPPPVETREERLAWGALDRAREVEAPNSNTRKRKARSITASPAEPVQEPERKLKRPRTRRLPVAINGEASTSAASSVAGPSSARVTNGGVNGVNGAVSHPPLVSSLLKELEPYAGSDDETLPSGWRAPRGASSPAMSPAQSPHSSPRIRALSMTPPPMRPTSPPLSLSTHIEPRYLPANYSPNRNGSDGSDSEYRSARPEKTRSETRCLEVRQPRPLRKQSNAPRVVESSPTRDVMTKEEKQNINDIVKCALRPHWRAQKLTSDQYMAINRDISRKLYEEVRGASSFDEETRRSWENRATQEVAQAVAGLQA